MQTRPHASEGQARRKAPSLTPPNEKLRELDNFKFFEV